MSKKELNTYNVEMKLHGFITIQLKGENEKEIKEIIDSLGFPESFRFSSPIVNIEDSEIGYYELIDVQRIG